MILTRRKLHVVFHYEEKRRISFQTIREVALKVLDSQCKKVLGNKEAKETVNKSFFKLFNGKYSRRFDELTKEQRNKMLHKCVQHYLPWRVVYKESVSTPCRTVMDASTKTPLKPN